jgi:hypothetical protein
VVVQKKFLTDFSFKIGSNQPQTNLYDEQLAIMNSPSAKDAFERFLHKLNEFLNQPHDMPRSYFCYAHPTSLNQNYEKWVIPLLSNFYDHLKLVGVKPVMEDQDLGPGQSSIEFCQYFKNNKIILFLTPSMKETCNVNTFSADIRSTIMLCDQVSIAVNNFKQNPDTVKPVLLYGDINSSLPNSCDSLKSIVCQPEQYLQLLKTTINFIYKSRLEQLDNNESYQKMWDEFINEFKVKNRDNLRIV